MHPGSQSFASKRRAVKKINLKKFADTAVAASAFAMWALPVYPAEPIADIQGHVVDAEDAFHLVGVNTFSGTGDRATSLHKCRDQNGCVGLELQSDRAGEYLTKGGTIGKFA